MKKLTAFIALFLSAASYGHGYNCYTDSPESVLLSEEFSLIRIIGGESQDCEFHENIMKCEVAGQYEYYVDFQEESIIKVDASEGTLLYQASMNCL